MPLMAEQLGARDCAQLGTIARPPNQLQPIENTLYGKLPINPAISKTCIFTCTLPSMTLLKHRHRAAKTATSINAKSHSFNRQAVLWVTSHIGLGRMLIGQHGAGRDKRWRTAAGSVGWLRYLR